MKRSKARILRKLWILPLAVFVIVMLGCATTKPLSVDPLAYKNRAKTSVNEDVTVTVAVPTNSEARAIYGVDLASKNIQPVWLEVRNQSADIYWFLRSGLDPDYFSPSEAAFAFHKAPDEAYRKTGETFQKLEFKNPVRPGSTEAGFTLVNLDEGLKAIDIDLISREKVKSFSFIIPDPDFKGDYKLVDFDTLYDAGDIIKIEDEQELRRVLEELPCCTTNADGDEYGDFLNLVIVGEPNDIIPALARRNWHVTEVMWYRAILRSIKSFLQGERYRYAPFSPLYVYGRRQDVGWQKARSSINERNHMRFWLSPIRFRGKRVFVGQISRDIGVKFTFKSPTLSTHVIDADVDEARRYFVEDLAYSQALSRIGYVKGVGNVSKEAPKMNLGGDPIYTDGLRAVLFLEPRPYSISEIEQLQWETPSAHPGRRK